MKAKQAMEAQVNSVSKHVISIEDNVSNEIKVNISKQCKQ